MDYAVLQSSALANGGAVGGGANGKKRSADAEPSNTQHTHPKQSPKKFRRQGNGGSHVGPSSSVPKGNGQGKKKKPFRSEQEIAWLRENNRCYHCCASGHSQANGGCPVRNNGGPAADMPAAFGKSPKA